MIQGGLFDERDPETVELPQAQLTLWRQFLEVTQTGPLFDALERELAWEQSIIQVYGRPVSIPRLNAWYADSGRDYAYSGARMPRHNWHPLLAELKQKIEALTGVRFNSVLANLYRDGDDSVGWHSDDEPELGRNPNIASLSLGVSRRFLLKRRKPPHLQHELNLNDGSLLLMAGETQHFWYHAVPKQRRIRDARINLTFRYIRD